MAVVSADYTTVCTALRRVLGNGTNLTGEEKRLALDVVQHAANTLDSKGAATAVTANTDADVLEALLVTLAAACVTEDTLSDALEALLVTHFGILVADGAAPTQAHVDDMVAACATPRTDLIAATTALVAAKVACATPRTTAIASQNANLAAAAATITNITANDTLDGRAT